MSEHVIIIGNGIAGITAARHIRKKSNCEITVVSKESKHFYSRTALMYIYMGHMRYEDTKPYEDGFWKKNKISLIQDSVLSIDTDVKHLVLDKYNFLKYDKLIIASGSKSNSFGWPGEDLDGVQGLYNLQDLELMEKKTDGISSAVITGGGLIGVEMAEMLISRGIKVTMLVRESHFWNCVLPEQEAKMISKHIASHVDALCLSTNLESINGDDNDRVKSVSTSHHDDLSCQFVGLTVGVSPNIDFVKDSKIDCDRGVFVNEFLETNIKDVYAIGDCAQFVHHPTGRRKLEQVWYTGKIMGETLAETITGTKTMYNPGIWYNSAKFFDIEYQTYGNVPNELMEGQSEFYWEHEDETKCIHVIYNTESKAFLGINTFGIRMRHAVMDAWLAEGLIIEQVIARLSEANFDPEFYTRHESKIIEQFNKENGTNIQPPKKGWFSFLSK
ncbi:MAG: FAD-dependent oxidoreductase [Flavobacteriales bacterium]|nr:FAD-dependent oxidoreductase [Flavobacteriales bacterium]